MTNPLSGTERTSHRRLREQGRTDWSDLFAVLASGLVAHLGVVSDGWPMVVPTSYGFDDTTLYLHGSVASVSLRADSPICVTITLADGLVLARSVFEHALEPASPWKFPDPALEPAGRGEIPCSEISSAHASGRALARVKHNPPSPAFKVEHRTHRAGINTPWAGPQERSAPGAVTG